MFFIAQLAYSKSLMNNDIFNTPETVQSPDIPSTEMDKSPTPTTTKRSKKNKPQKTGFLSTIVVILAALLLAFTLVTYVFHSYQVDGPSMQPTLQNGDRLIVWKVPRTIARITGNPYIPNRGDVVVFTESGLSGYGQSEDKKQLIKRVIGLPGDRIIVKDGILTVYNNDFPDGFQPDKTVGYTIADGETNNDTDVTVKIDEVFVSGDNRANSLDSRFFGPIKADQIIGKLVLRVLPLGDITKF